MSNAPTVGISASRVCKSFGNHLVLDKVNLTVDEGSILALLGPNGAGKTTIVRILSTLIPADSGSMRIAGHDEGHCCIERELAWNRWGSCLGRE